MNSYLINLNENLLIVLAIFLFLLVLFNYLIFKIYKLASENRKLKEIIGQLHDSMTYKFESDTEFLNFIISYKCGLYISNTFKTRIELNQSNLLRGELLDSAVNEVTIEIYNSLSDNYKNVLMKYFTKNSLQKYIAEITMEALVRAGTDINANKIKNIFSIPKENSEKKETIEFRKKDIDSNE